MTTLSRRALLASLVAAPVVVGTAACARSDARPRTGGPAPSPDATASSAVTAAPARGDIRRIDLGDLETRFGARIGLFLGEAGGGIRLGWRERERFAFCSTYKALAAAAVLRRVGIGGLERVVRYDADKLVSYSPVTEQHVGDGMPLEAIAEAAVRQSDNTAGNLLFRELGGPAGLQRDLRARGDRVTRSDRIETGLNAAVPGDVRDTSDAATLAADLGGYLVRGWLQRAESSRLRDWMTGNATGDALVRAAAPASWTVLDKSGAGSYGTRNDLAAVLRPGWPPMTMAVLSTHDEADARYDDALVSEVAGRAFAALG